MLLLEISEGGTKMAGDRIEVDIWRDVRESYGHHTTNRSRGRAVQKLIVERSAITNAFGRKLPPLLRTPPRGAARFQESAARVRKAMLSQVV